MSIDNVFIMDTEVFAHDYVVVAKEKNTGKYYIFHNDAQGIRFFIEQTNGLFAMFNGKHYDRFIISAICKDGRPEVVKKVNDFIIAGNMGWDFPDREIINYKFDFYDLMDDCQMGLSLKAIEAHLGMDIRETTVSFDIDRPLSDHERDEVIFYCKHDVDATDKLNDLRQDYLLNKIKLGNEKGIPARKALYMTNAKLTAAFLDAEAQEHWDEREYVYPDTLLRKYIPDKVFEFFDRLKDDSISTEDIFKEKLEIMVGDCPCTIAYGGIHGAIPCYQETESDDRTIRNKDVASYYPHQMILNGYCSRNIPSPEVYKATIERRVAAKKAGDKATANALKLVLNTTYGAMLNRYNDLYDPLMGRSVCISGQLQLLELALHLIEECNTLKVIQLNTDGIMVSLDNSDIERYEEVTQEWEKRTGFELEEDFIHMICQRDVNNYVEVPVKGSPKIKGGVLVRGIAPAGAFNINNNAVVIARAVKEFIANGVPVEETINASTELLDFQLIAKASSKYTEVYHEVDGELVSVQRVNRVYASNDYRYGTLLKRHKTTENLAKIASLPPHCIVDNANELTLDVIDRSWYVNQAKRYCNEFLGIKSPKRNTRKLNSLKKQTLMLLKEE